MHEKKKTGHLHFTIVVRPHKTGWENKGQTMLQWENNEGYRMVPWKTLVLENFGPISTSWKHLKWVSKSHFWVILRLGVSTIFNFGLVIFWHWGLAVLQSHEFTIL